MPQPPALRIEPGDPNRQLVAHQNRLATVRYFSSVRDHPAHAFGDVLVGLSPTGAKGIPQMFPGPRLPQNGECLCPRRHCEVTDSGGVGGAPRGADGDGAHQAQGADAGAHPQPLGHHARHLRLAHVAGRGALRGARVLQGRGRARAGRGGERLLRGPASGAPRGRPRHHRPRLHRGC